MAAGAGGSAARRRTRISPSTIGCLGLRDQWQKTRLGFLKGSHSTHYNSEEVRRPTCHRMIRSGELKPGYACDNDAGIFFQDNEVKRVVATRPGAMCYHVSLVNGEVVERVLEPEMIE